MRKDLILFPVILSLFDGGAAAGGAAGGGAPAAGAGAAGETQGAAPGDAGRGKAGDNPEPKILYGKQPQQEAKGDQVRQADAGTAKQGEDLSAEFREAINGKYKDAFTAEMQRIIDRRFKEAKTTEAALNATKPLTDLLMQRYGIADGDMGKLMTAVENDDPTLSRRAEENGMSVEQQRQMDRYERENRQLRAAEAQRVNEDRARETTARWMREAEDLVKEYPGFDLRSEIENPDFMRLLRAGIPVRHAYEVTHRDEIMRTVQQRTAASTEKRVVDDIRANGRRPRENGTSSNQGAFITKTDPSKFTKEDHARIRERVRAGERIIF